MVASAAIFMIATLWSGVAEGQTWCGPHDVIIERLARNYQEQPVASGVNAVGVLVEVFATPDGATWTIVVVQPSGWTCYVSSGEGWRKYPVEVPGEKT